MTFENINWGALGIIVGVIAVIVAVLVPVWLHRLSGKQKRRDEKIATFNRLENEFKQRTSSFDKLAYEYYKSESTHTLQEANRLFYKPVWIHQPCDEIIKLSEIDITLEAAANDFTKTNTRQRRFLRKICPDKDVDLIENMRRHLVPHRRLGNAPLFALNKFTVLREEGKRKKAELSVYVSDFPCYINTCRPFVYETIFENIINNLQEPSRNSIRRQFALADTKNRCVQIGVAVLTVLKNVTCRDQPGDETRRPMFLVLTRSDEVTTNPRMKDFVPAGCYEPMQTNLLKEGRLLDTEHLMTTVKREFLEELCSERGAEVGDLRDFDVLKDRLHQSGLDEAFDNTYLLGAAFLPLQTHFDIFAVSVIDVKSIAIGQTAGEILQWFTTNFEGTVDLIPFTRPYLNQYMQAADSTSGLQFAINIILGDFENITTQLKIS